MHILSVFLFLNGILFTGFSNLLAFLTCWLFPPTSQPLKTAVKRPCNRICHSIITHRKSETPTCPWEPGLALCAPVFGCCPTCETRVLTKPLIVLMSNFVSIGLEMFYRNPHHKKISSQHSLQLKLSAIHFLMVCAPLHINKRRQKPKNGRILQ